MFDWCIIVYLYSCLKCCFVAEPQYSCLTENILVHGSALCYPIVCLEGVETDQNKGHQHYINKIILISLHGSLLVCILFVCLLTFETFEHHRGLKIQLFWYVFIQEVVLFSSAVVPWCSGATVLGLRNAGVEETTVLKTEQRGTNMPEGFKLQWHGCENLASQGS